MRISDWSSDVCSSDLLAGVPDQREFPAFDVVQIIAADLLGAGHRHDQALVAVIAADDDGIALAKVLGQEFLDGGEALVGKFAPNTIGRIGIADDPVSILVGDGGADVVTGNREQLLPDLHRCQIRSEEHTSELQSLMRNSYAVFCLK